ncbi:hypothetical protein RTE01_43260 [Raoultella terrigena]|nr:hypothetical protein RTE01_43260 [Raoultella terrigena]
MVSVGLSLATVAEKSVGFLGGSGGMGMGMGPNSWFISNGGCPALSRAGGVSLLSAAKALAAAIETVANRAMIVLFIFVTS